jgi:putative ABC transport system permease protein
MFRWLKVLAWRFRGWLSARQIDEDFSEELATHLEMLKQENIRRGMTLEQAHRAARIRLGGATQLHETNRELRSLPFLETTLRDLRYSLRMQRKNLGLTFIIGLMLALGIGVNATVFCWLQTIVLNPLPGVSDPTNLVSIVPYYQGHPNSSGLSYPDFRDLAQLKQVFSGVMGSHYTAAILTVNGDNQWTYGRVATANTFEVLGVKPEKGRGFLPEEDRGEGGHPVLVISHSLWRERFGGDPNIIGRNVELNRHLFTIVGVVPRELQGVSSGYRTDFWAPLCMHNEVLQYGSFESRSFRWVTPLARLRPEVSPQQAAAAVTALSSQLDRAYPDSNKDLIFRVFTLRSSPIGGQAEFLPILRILFAVGIGVLLIVAINVANLLFAHGATREKEIAIRRALGAGPVQLLRQLLTENLLLGGLGGALGILFTRRALPLFSLFMPTKNVAYSYQYDFHVNAQTWAFAAGLTIATVIIIGVLPALRLSNTNLRGKLEATGRGSGGSLHYYRVRNVLVISEVATAFVLLICAGLCIKGFEKAKRIELGFDPQNLLCAQLTLVPNGFSAEHGKVFDRQLRERLASLPGVTGVGLSTALPLGVGNIFSAVVDVDGHTPAPSEDHNVSFNMVSPGYFATMRIPLLEGRDFTDQDDAARQNVVIVDETMARRFWPGLDPIGRRLHMAVGVAPRDAFTVVGVVKSGKYRSLSEPPTPFLYLAYQQRPLASLFMGVVIRASGNPEQLVPFLRREIHSLDASVEPLGVETVEQYIQPAFAQTNAAARFLTFLGGTSLLLASLGLYGVMAYAVSRRSHEIGVRMALGAQRWTVSKMVLMQGAILTLAGIALGFSASLLLTRLLTSFLYGVSAMDLATYAVVGAILGVVALMASYIPARCATRVDPIVALRCE